MRISDLQYSKQRWSRIKIDLYFHFSFQVERQFIAAAGIAGAVLPAIAGGAAAVAVINSDQDGLAQPLTELVGDKIYYFI